MSFFITVIAIGFVIFIHELGHMLAAKYSGIGVYEFAIGMGPKVFSRKWGETLYSLRLLPVGGFVKLAGIDDEEDNKDSCPEELSFYNKPLHSRLFTIAAGAINNLILGFVLFVIIFSFIGESVILPRIEKVYPDTPAFKAGLQDGDIIVGVMNEKVEDAVRDIIQKINAVPNQEIRLTYLRGESEQTITVTPFLNEENNLGFIGVQLSSDYHKYTPVQAIEKGMAETYRNIKMVFLSLEMLATGKAGLNDMAGPIGIIQLASHKLKDGVLDFLGFMAMISISLGVINLFPFPVLDGGHIFFLLLESVRRKPLDRKWETIINNVGAALLIALMLAIVTNDILNWPERVELLKNLGK